MIKRKSLRRVRHLTNAIEQLEDRRLLASVLGHSWQVESAPQRLVITFDADMRSTLQASDATVDNVTTDIAIINPAIDFSTDGKQATLTWPGAVGSTANAPLGVLPDGNYHLVLSKLDIPISSDFVADFFVKTGDADHNRSVNDNDIERYAAGVKQTLTGYSNGDFNYDGTVDKADYSELESRFATALRTPPIGPADIQVSALSAESVVVNWGVSPG